MSPASRILLPLVAVKDPCIICPNETSKGIDKNNTNDEYDTYEINGFHCTDAITAAVQIESGTKSCIFFTEAFKSSCCNSSRTKTTLSTTADTTQAIHSSDVGQILVLVLLVSMALLFYCLSIASMIYPSNRKVNATQIITTQDPNTQVAADMTLHQVNTVLRSSDDATVASECSIEDGVVTVSRIQVLPNEINVRPASIASILPRMLHIRKLNSTSS